MSNLTPSSFLLNNSKGRPDFIMTMLVVVILALLVMLVIWLGLNSLAMVSGQNLSREESNALVELMQSFNSNAQLIILGICSSVFTLAGTYYLRRSSYDNHHEQRAHRKLQEKMMTTQQGAGGGRVAGVQSAASAMGYVDNQQSTLQHPNYDDEEEDI
ncbi:MAG: hypothetical protein KTR17_00345 [Cellvibrionaceae bacterium]|nr:hypothetical protein [Cellvibrionaceae bacterium]